MEKLKSRHVWSKREKKNKILKKESVERVKKRNAEIRQGKPGGKEREFAESIWEFFISLPHAWSEALVPQVMYSR